MVEIRTRKKFWKWAKHAWLYIFWSTPGFKGRTFVSCGRGDLNFCVGNAPLRVKRTEKKRKENW